MVVVTDLDIFRLDEQQRTALMALLADFPEYCTLVLVIYDLLPYSAGRQDEKAVRCAGQVRVRWVRQQGGRSCTMGEAPLCRRRTRHQATPARSSAVHLRFLMTELVPEIGRSPMPRAGR